MGGIRNLARFAVTNNADGRIEVFATDTTTGFAWHTWQVAPNGGWHDWARLGGAVGLGALAAGRDADGRLEIFALDTASRFAWRAAQAFAGAPSGDWGFVFDQHTGFTAIAVAPNANASLQLAAVDSGGHADMVAGEFANFPGDPGFKASVTVISIDDVNRIATVRLVAKTAAQLAAERAVAARAARP